MFPFVLLLVKMAASFGILCLEVIDRSGSKDLSRRESVRDEVPELGGSLLLLDGPGGAGLRRDDRESMAVSGCGVLCLETKYASPAGVRWVWSQSSASKVVRRRKMNNSRQHLHGQIERKERISKSF
jgi:hypothetical protein